jgi:hypothetical protein
MAGHRLLLVHLFLPDTLSFQDWQEEGQNAHYRVPSQQKGPIPSSTDDVPPPPSPDPTHASLPVDELKNRLARASQSQLEDIEALSDSESPPPMPIPTQTRSRSARSSFNEQNRKISMSLLMSEAAQGGNMNGSGAASSATVKQNLSPTGSSHLLTRSRRGSAAGLNISVESANGGGDVPIPIATSSDHGRSAVSGKSPAHSPMPLPVVHQSSPTKGTKSTSNGFPSLLQASSSLLMTPAQFHEGSNEGSGTKAPGAKVSGKAGTMTPLSIIGDLAVSTICRLEGDVVAYSSVLCRRSNQLSCLSSSQHPVTMSDIIHLDLEQSHQWWELNLLALHEPQEVHQDHFSRMC